MEACKVKRHAIAGSSRVNGSAKQFNPGFINEWTTIPKSKDKKNSLSFQIGSATAVGLWRDEATLGIGNVIVQV